MNHMHSAHAPPLKRPVNLSVDGRLVAEAREFGIPLSAALEDVLRVRIAAAREARWLAENKAAIADSNARVEREGMFSDALRSF